jgi:hypothetical protein
VLSLLLTLSSFFTFTLSAVDAPSSPIDLSVWKLQIPGPKEIKDLKNYSSDHFERTLQGWIIFHLDCAEKGHTPNTHYVRSELRHLPNWDTNSIHILSGIINVDSTANPDKVTVLQIHGITDAGDNAPPLLRIAVDNGDIYAHIKRDNSGDTTDHIKMLPSIGKKDFECTVKIENKHMIISVNGVEKVNKDLSFWKYPNYFKAGCYPQALKGKVHVTFKALRAE